MNSSSSVSFDDPLSVASGVARILKLPGHRNLHAGEDSA